ncbi:4115_t:CDS:2 [Entrophospora sp. SA101]|nr:4115_t:CDS:2 [Entrophospora sp. SA101]CAJ0899094.1 3282_t:CDS:2 [Entrophospora sp. SA101]
MSAEIAKGIVKDILTCDEKLYASSITIDHENPLDVKDSEQNDKNPSDQRKDNDSNAIEDNKVIIKGKENKDPIENVIGEDAVFAEDLIKDYWAKLETTKSSEDVKSPVKSRTTATGSKNTAPTTPNKDRKRASTSSPSVNQESKNQHTSKKIRIEEIKNEPDDNTSDNWDDDVISVETVSRMMEILQDIPLKKQILDALKR